MTTRDEIVQLLTRKCCIDPELTADQLQPLTDTEGAFGAGLTAGHYDGFGDGMKQGAETILELVRALHAELQTEALEESDSEYYDGIAYAVRRIGELLDGTQ